jgi:hypothetical protein
VRIDKHEKIISHFPVCVFLIFLGVLIFFKKEKLQIYTDDPFVTNCANYLAFEVSEDFPPNTKMTVKVYSCRGAAEGKKPANKCSHAYHFVIFLIVEFIANLFRSYSHPIFSG